MNPFKLLYVKCNIVLKYSKCIETLTKTCLWADVRWVCSKEVKVAEIQTMRDRSALLMCNLEKVLPPSFFDLQTHLICHLVDEVAIAGTVHARWMYWVERYMRVLKTWVRQRARPEGSMAAGYLHAEALFYSGGIIASLDKAAPTAWEEAQDESQMGMKLMGASSKRLLDNETFRLQIHNYVLGNHELMSGWREDFR